ncbi:MAG: hypothetical protein H7X95_14385, partial [Deltaproteobacteria bacterium]|nr:hypothetical protein [Deltaproteobacteria bacterium]
PCALPAVDNGPGIPPSFDCISDSATPAGAGMRDGRVFNTFILNATGQVIRDNFNNPNYVDPREARVVRPFFRIHARHVDVSSPAAATGGPCSTLTNSSSQIGCLVKASPCSIGFGGVPSIDAVAPFRNFAFRIAGVLPPDASITALTYPLSRKLWFNSYVAGGIAFGPTLTAAEQALYACFSNPAIIDPIMAAREFIPVPAGLEPRLRACPGGSP